MTITSMALPVDIPWERWCVSEDMIDKEACDSDFPAKWQSSIVVFRYVPDDDYQIYPKHRITYIKIVCTIAGYQPKADEIQGIMSNLGGLTITPFTQDELDSKLSTYVPCNEAILQVTVAPPKGSKVPLEKYPYFMDFQPKKREMLETATDTNEFMSRSLGSLNISKSAGSTQSQEVLDIDQGFNVGAGVQASYAGAGGGVNFNYGQQGQWGTKSMGGNQGGTARTTDESHERRETVSHTAQISQLWHQLDSYHVGTNRAVFFVQPRPHVLQAASGFVGDSPRPIEGIQEFFLIVSQPKDSGDFCVGVRLDTGHLQEAPVMAYAVKTDTPDALTLSTPVPNPEDTDVVPDGSESVPLRSESFSLPLIGTVWTYNSSIEYDCVERKGSAVDSYVPPPDQDGTEYVIDIGNVSQTAAHNAAGFSILPTTQTSGDASFSVVAAPDGSALSVSLQANARACFKGPINAPDIAIHPDALAAALAAGFLAGIDPGTLTFLGSLAVSGDATLVAAEKGQDALAYASAPKTRNTAAGSVALALQVYLRSKDPIVDTGKVTKTFFITTRGLCCCGGHEEKQREGIVYEAEGSIASPAGTMTIADSNRMRLTMRQEMLRSEVSSRRTAPRPFAQSQLAVNTILPVVLKNTMARRVLNQRSSDFAPHRLVSRASKPFQEALKYLTRLQLLKMDIPTLANASGLDVAAIHELKAAMMAKPFDRPSTFKVVQSAQSKTSKPAKPKPRRSGKRQ